MVGTIGTQIIFGELGDDQLYGLDGADALYGEDGSDRLFGGGGNDVLSGGAGNDRFVFNTAPSTSSNADTISDFTAGDLIVLSQSVFAGIGATLDVNEFGLGANATTAAQRILYDSATGEIRFDADGSGASVSQLIARVGTGTTLTISSFEMIA
jgi:serralysin